MREKIRPCAIPPTGGSPSCKSAEVSSLAVSATMPCERPSVPGRIPARDASPLGRYHPARPAPTPLGSALRHSKCCRPARALPQQHQSAHWHRAPANSARRPWRRPPWPPLQRPTKPHRKERHPRPPDPAERHRLRPSPHRPKLPAAPESRQSPVRSRPGLRCGAVPSGMGGLGALGRRNFGGFHGQYSRPSEP